jgi:uncharacterized protein YerC
MRRYHFLQKDDIYEALNKVRDALLAAHDGNDVEQIMKGILTFDEQMKIGRRIQIAELLLAQSTFDDIKLILKVGSPTIEHVAKNLEEYEKCFNLISLRKGNIDKQYQKKAFNKSGGSQKVNRRREYTGFKRKDLKR